MSSPQKITTFLWFDDQAEEAIAHYASVFDDSRMLDAVRVEGRLLTATFQLAGQTFIALNGGPQHRFNEAISLFVSCESQREIDETWARLLEGGEERQCGWLEDRYGLSWQIVPQILPELLGDADPARAGRAMQALLGMRKLDVAALRRAWAGG